MKMNKHFTIQLHINKSGFVSANNNLFDLIKQQQRFTHKLLKINKNATNNNPLTYDRF